MTEVTDTQSLDVLRILQELVESVQTLDRAMREATQQLRLRDDAQQKMLIELVSQVAGLAPSLQNVLIVLKPVVLQKTADERVNAVIEHLEQRLAMVGNSRHILTGREPWAM